MRCFATAHDTQESGPVPPQRPSLRQKSRSPQLFCKRLSNDSITILDNAPGISSPTASKHVFKFGRSQDQERQTDRLSVYGLGLKRAFFKLGNRVKIASDHVEGGFELDLDVSEWARTSNNGGWTFELLAREPVTSAYCGTRIEISELYTETQNRMSDGLFPGRLRDAVAKTYAYFLSTFVRIFVNGEAVAAIALKLGKNRSTERFELNDVSCAITAGLGISEGGKFREKSSGWFIFCNGRTVVEADKTALTGWNGNGLPIFQPKHRPFFGTVYFVSRFADRLPWDTTKSRINEDSQIWQKAKPTMVVVGRTVTAYLDGRYSDDGTDVSVEELNVAAKGEVDAMIAATSPKTVFERPPPALKASIRIQYSARVSDVGRISGYLSKPEMSGSEVGRHTSLLQNS